MRTYLDCIPCFARQSLEAARMATDDPAVQERVLRDVLRALSEIDFADSPPAMAQRIHRLIRQATGRDDPYRALKQRFTRMALALLPGLRERAARAADPRETALRLAIAGNVIDLGVNGSLDEADVLQAVDEAASAPLAGDVRGMFAAAEAAEEILYLADNAGEIVFDRLLLERLPAGKVTVVVKGSAILNDATAADARASGLPDNIPIIDNGSDAPGTILRECSERFRRRFARADLVLAKGQGNYETLSEVEKDVFFMLKVKCPVIARHLGCEIGEMVLRRSREPVNAPEEGDSYARI
jgi:hypothetical protein